MTPSDTPIGPGAIAPRDAALVRRYAVAVAAVAAALLFRSILRDLFGLRVPFLQFYPAIVAASWYGGLGPGLVATGLSALASAYFLLPPGGLAVGDGADQLSLAVFAGTGALIAWLNHRGDLTRRMNLEGRLGASEARWQAVIDSAVDGIVVIDAHGRVETFNPAAERLFGYGADEVVGRNVDMLMPSPYREEHDSYLSRYLATGRAKIIGIGREVQGRRKDGSIFPLHLSVGQITIEGERKFTGILHDLTPRVRLEEQLREQAALARLGEMAAVVAHEVKNPLAGIRGVMQVLHQRMGLEGPNTPVLKEIVARIDSLDDMMKDLLVFARPPKPKRMLTDVGPLVANTARLLAEDPSWRDVDVEVDGAVRPVAADAEMLKIVFQNLLINGAHAMQGHGRIHVAIDEVDAMCQVAFSDAGPGIPVEVRDKVFTPFFTTKSRGSGLGLPTARRFVEAHGGEIAIDCPPAGGTTVVVRIPMSVS